MVVVVVVVVIVVVAGLSCEVCIVVHLFQEDIALQLVESEHE